MKRYFIIVDGRVQGVGFRYFCLTQARLYGLTGWVQNQINGTVALEVQGPEENIQAFLKTLRKGNTFIRIDDYQMKAIALEEDSDFKIYA